MPQPDHDYRTCRDPDCPRFPCRVYREGRHDGHAAGYAEGHAAGYGEGYGDGHAAGYAEGAASGR
jgi:hypothetical protein